MTQKEKRKKYAHEYYLRHKEELLEANKKWRQSHKKRFSKLVYKSRKKKAKRLKEAGEIYIWCSDIERKRLKEQKKT